MKEFDLTKIIKTKKMHFHQIIHQYLIDYRNEKDATFNFMVRQRASSKDKNFVGGKFAHGLVFQGNNDYCFVGLVNRSGGANATRSVGLVFKPVTNGYMLNFDIVFPGEQDEELIRFYKNLASKFENVKWDPKGTRAYITIGKFKDDEPDLIYNWLNISYPIIRQTALDSGIEDLIPDDDKFNGLQTNLKNKLKEASESLNIYSSIVEQKEKPSGFSVNQLKRPLNQILYGPPGTGKTFNTINKAIKIINPLFDFTQKRKVIKAEFERLVNEKQIVFSTFHQSMSYEDFVEGIKPITKDGNVTYEVKDGIFRNICRDAELYSLDRQSSVSKKVDLENRIKKLKDELEQSENSEIEISMTNKSYHITSISDKHIKFRKASGGTGHDLVIESLKGIALGEKELIGGLRGYYDYLITHLNNYEITAESVEENKPFVLIIDEINRGNVSQIFGELITLIEKDKRLGEDEALKVQLPYSKTEFGVPPNLFIVGTMNTADRSIEALDTALRRRFVFEEMPPKPKLLKTEGKSGKVNGIINLKDDKSIDLEKLLITINNRIEKLIDKDHKIGHSYFLKVNSEKTLKKAFKNKVIPLLEEYFFGDYGKIGLILGDSFIDRDDVAFTFSEFKHYDSDIVDDLKSKLVFKITNQALWDFNTI